RAGRLEAAGAVDADRGRGAVGVPGAGVAADVGPALVGEAGDRRRLDAGPGAVAGRGARRRRRPRGAGRVVAGGSGEILLAGPRFALAVGTAARLSLVDAHPGRIADAGRD